VLEQPARRVLAIVGAGGERVLGREAIVDADGDEAGRGGQGGEVGVLQVGGAEHPAAAVHV
jgi:hypothetical protein